MKSANETVKDIYLMLTGLHKQSKGVQLTASKIAVYLGVSRQYVSKKVKEFEKNNLIKCINPKERIKFYEATYHDFDSIYHVEKAEEKDEKALSTKSRPRREYLLQKQRYKVNIEREYTNFFEKHTKYVRGNCACYKFRTKIFDDMGEWTFEKQGKNTLIIIIPEMTFSMSELIAADTAIFNVTYEALKWFCNKAKIRIDWRTLKQVQKPHVTKKALSPKAKRVARKFSLSIDGKMLDMSSGCADFETEVLNPELMETVSTLEQWDRLALLEGQLSDVREDVFSLKGQQGIDPSVEGRISELEEKQEKMLGHINVIAENLSVVKRLLKGEDVNENNNDNKKEEDKKDENRGMYR